MMSTTSMAAWRCTRTAGNKAPRHAQGLLIPPPGFLLTLQLLGQTCCEAARTVSAHLGTCTQGSPLGTCQSAGSIMWV